MLWIQETSRCRKNRSSCWVEFGQAFSMLNGKNYLPRRQSLAEPALSRCINASRQCKCYPSLNSDSRTRRTPKALPAHGGQAVRDRRPVRFARQLTDQASAPGERAVRYPLTRGAQGTGGVKSCRGSCQLPLQANHLPVRRSLGAGGSSSHFRYDLRARHRCWPRPR